MVNKTLQDIQAFDKPVLLVFNKMDQYEKDTFDPWLDDQVKKEMLEDLQQRWKRESRDGSVFVSATEKTNLDQLRAGILEKVKELYRKRYPYKSEQFYG